MTDATDPTPPMPAPAVVPPAAPAAAPSAATVAVPVAAPAPVPATVSDATPSAPVTSTQLRYLDPARLEFTRDGAELRVTLTDEFSVLDARVVRIFPISDPDRQWSVRDAKGNEIGIVSEPARLRAAARRLAEEAIDRRYLLPVITRIVSARDRFGTTRWKIETDHGPKSFVTRNLREEVVTPMPGRYLLKDIDGNRYDVPDVSRLDVASQGLLLGRL
jgi:hypothetical protein